MRGPRTYWAPSNKKAQAPRHPGSDAYACCTVHLSLKRTVFFEIFDFENCRDLEIQVKGHSRSLKVVPFGRSCMVSYQYSSVTLSLKRTVFDIFDL